MEMKWGWTNRPAILQDIKDDVGKGWGDIVERLILDLEKLGWDGTIYQIKEKFGGMDVHIGEGTREIWDRINQAGKEARNTCQNCAKPGKIDSWGKWWLLCLCPECGEIRRNSKP